MLACLNSEKGKLINYLHILQASVWNLIMTDLSTLFDDNPDRSFLNVLQMSDLYKILCTVEHTFA